MKSLRLLMSSFGIMSGLRTIKKHAKSGNTLLLVQAVLELLVAIMAVVVAIRGAEEEAAEEEKARKIAEKEKAASA